MTTKIKVTIISILAVFVIGHLLVAWGGVLYDRMPWQARLAGFAGGQQVYDGGGKDGEPQMFIGVILFFAVSIATGIVVGIRFPRHDYIGFVAFLVVFLVGCCGMAGLIGCLTHGPLGLV